MRRDRILVIATGHLGDIVGALPALRALRSARPQAHIAVLMNEYSSDALDGCPYVDEVIPGFGYRPRGTREKIAFRAAVLRRVAGRFGTTIVLRGPPSSAPFLALLSGARVRAGFSRRDWRRRFLTHDLGRPPIRTSSREVNLLPLHAIGVEATAELPPLDWVSTGDQAHVREFLESAGLGDDEPFAVLQISSHWGCNEWLSAKWAELVDELWERLGVRSIITGTNEPFETAKLEEVAALASHRPISAHGRTTIPQLFELVRRASLVVASDSALTQIALAQRTPSVVMFGLRFREENGPLASEAGSLMVPIQHVDEAHDPPPNPHCRWGESSCHTANCRENVSLERTCVTEVVEAAAGLLARPPARVAT